MKKTAIITIIILILVLGAIYSVRGLVIHGYKTCQNNSWSICFSFLNAKISNTDSSGLTAAAINCLDKNGRLINGIDKDNRSFSVCRLPGGAECEVKAYLDGRCQTKLALEYAKNGKEVSREWITKNSPTFIFDGYNLEYGEMKTKNGLYAYDFYYSFTSRHSGYGDRASYKLDKQSTSHKIVVSIEAGKIISVINDGVFDEMMTNGSK